MFGSSSGIFLLLLFTLSIWSMQQQLLLAIRPSEEHSSLHEDDTTAISPAMIAFFGGDNRTAAPAVNNSPVPKWRLPAPELQQKDNGVRTIVLVAGTVCGAIGIGLLVTAAMAYAAHIRKPRPEARLGAV